jgi:hypothetical protein
VTGWGGWIAGLIGILAGAVPLGAQGAGSAGAQVLQMPAGSRAAALSGAYAAAVGDADVIFYNPAGVGTLGTAASAAYQHHVADIALGSLAGAFRFGRLTVGAGVAFLDAGEIDVIEPDPDYGGHRGRATGARASASESALRVAAALPVAGERVRLGAGVGFLSSDLAGLARSGLLLDLGAQLALGQLTLGVAMRNLGASLSGAGAEGVALPGEARLGAAFEVVRANGIGAALLADLVREIEARTTSLNAGAEIGLLPGRAGPLGAVARVGYAGDDGGTAGLGSMHFGAGIIVGRIALDYTVQSVEFFGAAHRMGVRWSRASR